MSEAGGGHVDGGSRQRRRLRAIVGRVAGWQSSTFFSSQYQRILQVYTLLALPGPVSIKCLDQRVGHITRYRFWPHSKASKASKARGPRFADSKVMYSSLLEQRRLYRCSCRAILLCIGRMERELPGRHWYWQDFVGRPSNIPKPRPRIGES